MAKLTDNKKAFHSFTIEDTLEAGVSLFGHEVKSVRDGQVSLAGAYVTIRNGEAFLRNAHIGKYKHASDLAGYDETRERRLLLKKSEIDRLIGKAKEKGLTLVPLELYTKRGWIKLKVGIGRGKKQADKREAIKTKETKRRIDRLMRKKV
ncbi:MAG: SsrA-binding protein SmpB [Candidatus Saccharibacteria bacterium]